MPAPAVVAPVRKPKSLDSVSYAVQFHYRKTIADVQSGRDTMPAVATSRMSWLQSQPAIALTLRPHHPLLRTTDKSSTHPPLKAPTGFLTGAITASCLNAALVWKLRETAGALVATERRMRDAIVVDLLAVRVVLVYFGWAGVVVSCGTSDVVWSSPHPSKLETRLVSGVGPWAIM
jgi:hypothetical protein